MISNYAKLLGGIAVVIALAAAGAFGYSRGYATAKARGDAALQTIQSAQQQAEITAASAYAVQVQRGDDAEKQLITAQDTLTRQTRTIREQIDAVTQTYVPVAGAVAVPAPGCIFTRGFVRLWNAAAGASTGAVQDGDAARDAAGAPDATDALDSGVSQADVLDWFAGYAARSRERDEQLNRLIDLAQPASGVPAGGS